MKLFDKGFIVSVPKPMFGLAFLDFLLGFRANQQFGYPLIVSCHSAAKTLNSNVTMTIVSRYLVFSAIASVPCLCVSDSTQADWATYL